MACELGNEVNAGNDVDVCNGFEVVVPKVKVALVVIGLLMVVAVLVTSEVRDPYVIACSRYHKGRGNVSTVHDPSISRVNDAVSEEDNWFVGLAFKELKFR